MRCDIGKCLARLRDRDRATARSSAEYGRSRGRERLLHPSVRMATRPGTVMNSTRSSVRECRGRARRAAVLAGALVALAAALLFPVAAGAQCTNCTTTVIGNDVVHTFTQNGTFTPPAGIVAVQYLVVGGGGGGGGITAVANVGGAGGGGAGGMQSGAGFAVTPLTVYNIVVGPGGAGGIGGTGPGGTGGSSSFSSATAVGGGGGASVGNNNGVAGGSGGGGRLAGTGGAGTQGNNGGNGSGATAATAAAGGGGGAGTAGADGAGNVGGAGGDGASNSISGAAVTYAGGGGGGGFDANGGAGGAGGGGAAPNARGAGSDGTNGLGGGGGGAGGSASTDGNAYNGGAGGSGIVIIRYSLTQSQTGSPGAAANCTSLGGAGVNWTNPGNAYSSNDARAVSGNLDGTTTDPLRCLNFGFNIPLTATVVGIQVFIERRASAGGVVRDGSLYLVKGGSQVGANRATTTFYTNADVTEGHGSSSDLWGTTWTPAEINAANFGTVFTATKPSAAGAARTAQVDYIFITVSYTLPPPIVTPGSFNAFETSTAAGAITGVIRTRIAGAAFSLDVVAIAAGTQQNAFSDAVIVELLGNTALGTPLDANNCPTSFTLLQTVAPNPTITGGRSTVNFAAVPNAWRDVRVRVRWPTSSPTVTSCSTDNFAIRPASFAVAVTDATWDTAGTTRALTNTGAVGGNVHKAGQPFTITVTPSPGTATNYGGSPTISALACTLPAGCANGTLNVGTFGGAGTRVSNTATYDEAGAFGLTLVDQTFASVDSSDGTPADCTGQYVCQSPAPLAVGRFVPDRFDFTDANTPQFLTFNTAACASRSFTYIGQRFWYTPLMPSATVRALNAAGAVTTNYKGSLFKLAPAGIAETYGNNGVGPALDTTLIGTPSLASNGDGTGTYTADAAGTIAYQRSTTSPVPAVNNPFTANISLSVTATDGSESAEPGNGTIATVAPFVFNGGGSGIAFDAGAAFRYGRLRLGNANGSQLVPLQVPMETQYWNGSSFITNSADNCTTVTAANVGLGNYTPNLDAGETTPTIAAGPFSSGRKTLTLSAPGAGNNGSVDVVVNLGSTTTIDSCVTWGTTPAPAGADLTYLRGRWCGASYTKDPTARASFGQYRGAEEVIFIRENF